MVYTCVKAVFPRGFVCMVYMCVNVVFPRDLYSGGVHGLYACERCVCQEISAHGLHVRVCRV
jgi:hypothetical protein